MRSSYTRSTTTFLAVAFAVACSGDKKDNGDGGDDGGGGGTKTGMFVDSPVAKLHYATATKSGLTTAAGEFEYEAGETVTFTVGGISLGAAAGADRITPFDLFGVTPPTTQGGITTELNSAVVSNFQRAVNVAHLLQGLDVDGDPDNGIDLGTWDVDLASETLSFEASLQDFIDERYEPLASRHVGMQRYAPVYQTIAHLYAGLGIAFGEVKLTSQTVTDDGNDGSPNRIYRASYDAKGRRTGVLTDQDGDGDDDFRSITTYDANGFVATSTQEYDTDDNNTDFEDRDESVSTYNAVGDNVTYDYAHYEDNVLSGRVQSRSTYVGLLRTLQVDEEDDDADGTADDRSIRTTTYDNRGNPLIDRTEDDFGADGSIDRLQRNTFTYDAQNHRLTSQYESDNGNDGSFETNYLYTSTYDGSGFQVGYVSATLDGTGVVTSRETTTYTNNATGGHLTSTVVTDGNADGVPNARSNSVNTYDTAGRITVEDFYSDNDADGTPNSHSRTSLQRNAFGGVTVRLQEYDNDNDGTVDTRYRTTVTFDDQGNELTSLDERDSDGNGAYDDAGDLTTTSYTSFADALLAWLTGLFEQS